MPTQDITKTRLQSNTGSSIGCLTDAISETVVERVYWNRYGAELKLDDVFSVIVFSLPCRKPSIPLPRK
jgi:hypothetical protein